MDTEEGVRFTLLETIQEYCREKLLESRECAAISRRHRDYFLALAEAAETHLTGSDQEVWRARLEAEQDNLRAALAWCQAEEDEAEAGLRLTGALWRFWELHGDLREGRASLMKALGRAGAAEPTQARAKALNGAGVLAHSLSDYRAARTLHEESLAIYRELGDKQGIAFVLNGLGHITQEQSDYAAACRFHEESLAIRRELRDKEGIALSLYHLGNTARDQGDYATAKARYEECLTIRRELGDKQGIWAAYHLLGVIAEQEGDLAQARAIYEECLPVWRELHFSGYVAWTLHGLGFVATRQGDFVGARDLLTESLTTFREMEYTFGLVRGLLRLGGLAVAQGQRERAARLFGVTLGAATGALAEKAAQQEFNREVTVVRSALGEEAFAAAWAEGQAMSLEQAIVYALASEEVLPPN